MKKYVRKQTNRINQNTTNTETKSQGKDSKGEGGTRVVRYNVINLVPKP